MTSKSKSKGKSYENSVAKFLTSVFGDSFMRVPGSGALIGGSNNFRKNVMNPGQIKSFKGDIIPPDTWKHFHCEVKFYKDFPFHQLFLQKCKILDNWIKQVKQAEDPSDFNLILMKFNHKGEWVCVENKHGFCVDSFVDYKGWLFCHKDYFWTEHNISVIRKICT